MNNHEIVPALPLAPHILVATDGACLGNPGPGGWGYVLEDGDHRIERSGNQAHTTNNRMEALAIIEALSAIPSSGHVCVLSDSEITIRGLNEWRRGWKARGWKKSNGKPVANADLWHRLDALAEAAKERVSFHWVRGHAGFALNEEADRLANAAAEAVGAAEASLVEA